MTPRHGQIVGYVRVSSDDQNDDRQLAEFADELHKRFVDKASGKNTQRPELEALIRYVREGDVVVVHSMDRLARNLDDLRRLVQDLTRRGVRVRFAKENLEFSGDDSPMSNLLLSVLGAVAQFERDMIRERQREGIAIAKAKGNVYRGRAKALTPAQVDEVKRRIADGVPVAAVARFYRVSRNTVYRSVLPLRAGETA